MNPVALLGLALALGLRHAADPDHVVAVTAITARTRRVFPAMWLGVVWGLGHTVTLFTAGAAIILFNLVVPPRVGLTLELGVGLALVVVGLLNLKSSGRGGAMWYPFGLGTLAGMALITTGLATPLTAASQRWPRFSRDARLVTGM